MTKKIICWRKAEQMPAVLHHRDAVLDRNRKIKNVLQGTAIDYAVEIAIPFWCNRKVEIMYLGCILKTGSIEGMNLF